jgi:hypothetical protein
MAAGNGCIQIEVGQGYYARLHAMRLRSAEALEGAILQNAKKFALRAWSQCGNLIEDDGTGPTELETA